MDFLDKRVGVICNELKKLKVKQVFPLTQWEYKEGNFIHPEDALKDEAAWENFDCKTMHWYGKDRHYWFRTTYTVPEELDGKAYGSAFPPRSTSGMTEEIRSLSCL